MDNPDVQRSAGDDHPMVEEMDHDEFRRLFLCDGRPSDHPAEAGSGHEWRAWWDGVAELDPVAAQAASRGFVLRASELADMGFTRSAARWAVRQERWTSVAHGVVAPVDLRRALPDIAPAHTLARRKHALAGAAAVLVRPGEAVSGRTAAVMFGLPTMSVPAVPELNSRHESGIGRTPTAHLLAGTLDSWQMCTWFGVDVSDPARTVVDLARRDRRDGIMSVDAALRESLVDREEIERAVMLAQGWPGIRQARAVLALADARSESPLESIVRLALHDDGFPPPQLQVWIGGDRVDFYWPSHGLVLEADGRVKYDDGGDPWWREKQREQRLRLSPCVQRVERVTWAEATRSWPAKSAMLRSAFR